MNDDNHEQIGSFLKLLGEQVDIILAVIMRPVVQRQLLVFFVVLLLSWLLARGIHRLWQRHSTNQRGEQVKDTFKRKFWLAALDHLLTPIFVLVFSYIAIWLFAQQNHPGGLLKEMTDLIWLWFVYRLLLTVLQTRFGESMRPYQNWIITPIFLALMIYQILSLLPGFIVLIDTPIFIGAVSITSRSLLVALIILYLFSVTAWVIEKIMIKGLPEILNAEPAVIESVAKLTRYVLLAVGILLSLGMLGLDFTSFCHHRRGFVRRYWYWITGICGKFCQWTGYIV